MTLAHEAHGPLRVSWMLGGRGGHLASSALWLLPLDSPDAAAACMWTLAALSSYEPT